MAAIFILFFCRGMQVHKALSSDLVYKNSRSTSSLWVCRSAIFSRSVWIQVFAKSLNWYFVYVYLQLSDSPADFLQLLLPDVLLQEICNQTNSYAKQRLSEKPHAKGNRWTALTVVELKRFLGLLFLSGLVSKPELSHYWSTDENLVTPFFGRTMSRNRFQLIWSNLHFNDTPSKDPISMASNLICSVTQRPAIFTTWSQTVASSVPSRIPSPTC